MGEKEQDKQKEGGESESRREEGRAGAGVREDEHLPKRHLPDRGEVP